MRVSAGLRVHLRRVRPSPAPPRHCIGRARLHCARAQPGRTGSVPIHGSRSAYVPHHVSKGARPSAPTIRTLATVVEKGDDDFGPLQEYDRRVNAGLLRNDEHQRGEKLFPSALCHLLV